nr:hypothetical protein [Tanacetum cinerariifolium]
MIVAQQDDDAADEGVVSLAIDDVPVTADEPFILSPTPTTQPPPPSQDLPYTSQGRIIANMDADEDVTLKDVADIAKEDDEIEPAELKEVVEVVTTAKLMTEVVNAASATIIAATTLIPAATITDDVIDQVQRKEKEDNVVMRSLTPMWLSWKRQENKWKKKTVKKQKLDEEVEELKKHLQIVPNDEDDVYIEATPLALKVPVIDYAIPTENNKPYFKIIRADGTHQLFLSFLSLLRNFDREDLEVLWKLVKERFASSKPKNFSDDFLLTTLTYMFEKPNVEAQVWKSQRGIYERIYPLTRFTLDQMLNNVRSEVEEESKVSLELLRFIHNKAYKKEEKMYHPQFTKVIIHYFLTQDKTLSWRNKIEMHTSRDDYLINTLRFVSTKEETQIYGDILLESLTSPEMKETQAYMTYLGLATGAIPPKKARKFKKPASPKLTTVQVSTEESMRKETPEMPLSKKKEKVNVTRGKGIELLSQVGLTEKAQFKEVQRKSMRDFHKIHPSGSGTITKTDPSGAKIKPSITNEGTSVKPRVPDVTKKESSESEVESWGNDEEDSNNEQDSSDETKTTDKSKGDEDEEMDYTTSQLYNDVYIRLNEPVYTDKRVTTLEKEVDELKKEDPLKTQVAALVDEYPNARLGATKDEFMNYLSASITARIIKQVKNQLPQILLEEVSNFPPGWIKSYELDTTIFSTYGKVYSLKRKDKDEDPSVGADRGLKRKKTSKDAEPTKGPKAKESQSSSSKGDKSQSKSSRKSVQLEELEFEVEDLHMPQDQEENPGNDDEEPKEKENLEGNDYPFDLTKSIPLVMSGNHQKVPVDYFFYNDLKYLQVGVSTMTYTTSITKTKAAQYDFPGIKDMVLNIWVPVKVAYDKHALLGISHWREQRKTLYGYARGLQSTPDVYSTKRILAVTHVEVMRKHRRITFNSHLTFTFNSQQEMDQQYPTVAKIPVLDTRKFKQWKFWIQQYLQHEHYALWEVIEFKDSYTVPANSPSTTTTDTTSGEAGMKSGRTVTLTAEDMQKKKNDIKARTTLLLSLLDEHQLQFSKYKTARELWAAILKTFGGNEATKKTKKNLLKQQYGNFKAEGSETLEQTFNRLQMIVGQLQFMDIEVEQDDIN